MKKKIWISILCGVLALVLVAGSVFLIWRKKRLDAQRQACILPRHEALNTEVLETEDFYERPEAMVYFDHSFDQMHVLDQEQQETLYVAWESLRNQFYQKWPLLTLYSDERLQERIIEDGGVELRFRQRRHFVGELRAELPGGRVNALPLDLTYDAMLLIPSHDQKTLFVAMYMDGDYYGMSSTLMEVKYLELPFDRFLDEWDRVIADIER